MTMAQVSARAAIWCLICAAVPSHIPGEPLNLTPLTSAGERSSSALSSLEGSMLVGPPREYTPVYRDCIATATECSLKCDIALQLAEDMGQLPLQKLAEAIRLNSTLTIRSEQFLYNTSLVFVMAKK